MKMYGYESTMTDTGISYRVAKGRSVGQISPDEMDIFKTTKGFVDPPTMGTKPGMTTFDLKDVRAKLSSDKSYRQKFLNAYKELTGKTKTSLEADEITETFRFLEAKRSAVISVDGAIFGSKNLADKTHKFMLDQSNAIQASVEAEVGVKMSDDIAFNEALERLPSHKKAEIKRAISNVKSLKKNAFAMKSAGIHGGTFNFRAMGFGVDYAEQVLGVSGDEAIGLGKANVTIIGERGNGLTNWTKHFLETFSGYKGQVEVTADGKLINRFSKAVIDPSKIDFLGPMESLTKEFATIRGSDALRISKGSVSMSTLGEGTKVFVDPQTLIGDIAP
jgi:hypothetical protein